MRHFFFSPRPHKLRNAALIVGALTLAPVAQADIDWSSADWGGFSPNSLSYWSHSDSMRSHQIEQSRARSGRGPSAKPAPKKNPESALSTASNVFPTGEFRDGGGLDALARMYPREQFFERKKQYRQIVQGFNQSVQKLYGVPPNNLATGMTVVLAGAYSAYQNKSFPDTWVKPLYQQMEGLLLKDPRLMQRSEADKATDYQVMVGAGMAMMLAQSELEKSPNPAGLKKLRDTGADALRTLFQAAPETVEFSPSGLRVR
ncbi:DUF6683 family protein [Ottowia testudinis]|uniref:Uncharacterized protein n=1 Tax=Ottowia testudinis TaxID=2816950 RepID=A0A975CGT0_9BURK|nr:DUF6683 family protein [Ottowia testudinis]QTD45516.1 hypothetical protein J1M35_00880 [Ottowia testudinis]